MPLPTVTPLPTPPQRGQEPGEFVLNADTWVDAVTTFSNQLNVFAPALVSEFTAIAVAAAASNAAAAQAAEDAAEAARDQAVAAASSVNDANLVHKTGAETVGGLKTFSDGIKINNQTLDGLTAAGLALIEAADAPAQRALLNASGYTVVAQATSFTIASADAGKMYDVTTMAAPITATLPAASSVNAEFSIKIINRAFDQSTIRYVTLTRNGSDTIDGTAANLIIYGENVTLRRNAAGTGWLVEKSREALCWDFVAGSTASAFDFTVPFSDTQFEAYMIEYALTNGGTQQELAFRLGIGGTVITTNSYNVGHMYTNAGATPTAIAGTASSFASVRPLFAAGASVSGIIMIENARGTGGGMSGPRLKGRHDMAHDSIGLWSANCSTAGALSSFRIFAGSAIDFTAGSRFRIFGLRKGS